MRALLLGLGAAVVVASAAAELLRAGSGLERKGNLSARTGGAGRWPALTNPRRSSARMSWRLPLAAVDPRRLRLAGWWIACALLVLVAPPLGAALPVGWWAWRRLCAHRAQHTRARAVQTALPDLVDLLALATSAGLSLPVAHPLVAARTPDPVGAALLDAQRAAEAGQPRADALVAALGPLGDRSRALADALVDHLRYGVPLLPALERAGLELRLDRRRQAELDARRVPVRLLAPLVSCVLPAFALLTVVPLLVASLEALPT